MTGTVLGVDAIRDVIAWLPRGRALPAEAWTRRHEGLLALLWLHVPGLLVFGAAMGYTGVHALGHVAPLVLFALLGRWSAVPHRLQAVLVTMGLMSAAALAVHLSGGVTESHFLFFVLLIGLALYEDWLVFLLALGYVVVHHGLASSIGFSVYSHEGSGWAWAGVHGAFVLCAAALCVVSWRASEQARRELQEAEREKLASQLREAQKLESLGLLAGGIAHDFNNLLLGVLGNAALVREDLPAGSPLVEYVEQIELAGERAATLTRQMLAYAGNTRLESTRVELCELVEEIAQLTLPALSKRAVLDLRLEGARPLTVQGDAGQLSQVVMNLLTNAAESLPEGQGVVTVRTRDGGAGRAVLEVADDGCGMSDDTVLRIFEPFFTTKFTGRGLGLAAVSGIVRSHGGTIEVESGVGRGTTFRVELPLLDAPVATGHEQRPDPAEAPPATGRILVVDDEDAVREVASRVLEREGYEVVAASSGSEAVQLLLDAQVVDAAVVDMTMPGLNGIETLRALRGTVPTLPVILSSGHMTESLEDGLPPGTRLLQKPYRNGELVALVREVLVREPVAA